MTISLIGLVGIVAISFFAGCMVLGVFALCFHIYRSSKSSNTLDQLCAAREEIRSLNESAERRTEALREANRKLEQKIQESRDKRLSRSRSRAIPESVSYVPIGTDASFEEREALLNPPTNKQDISPLSSSSSLRVIPKAVEYVPLETKASFERREALIKSLGKNNQKEDVSLNRCNNNF